MVSLRLLSVIAALAAFGAASVADGQTPSAALECGDTITTDTTLDRDLSDCPSNGIVIGADDITLDLNGHSIAGDGEPVRDCPRRRPCDLGVFNDGHDGVTVRGGSLRGFAVGVLVDGVRRNHLVQLAASRNQFFGFVISESSRSTVRDSSGNDNPAPDGDGLGVFGSHGLRIEGNSFSRNGQIGIHIDDSDGNLVRGNVFARNGDFGILMEGDRNELRANRLTRNGVAAVQVGPGSRNVIARNHIRGDGEGIGIEDGRDDLVSRNVIAGVRHDGIRLGIWAPQVGTTRTVVRGNVVRDSGRDGYRVARRDRDALLTGNVARRSGDDGFDIDSASATLRGNRAVRSADRDVELP